MNAVRDLPRVVLAHPLGNQFFRHLAAALRDAGGLAELCTAIDWSGGGGLGRVLPPGVRRELERRNFSRALGVTVSTHPWREIIRLAGSRLGWQGLTRHETGAFSVDAVYRDFDAWVAGRLDRLRGANVAYAYEDAAEATFRAAGELGWCKAYDLPIAHWETSRRLLEEEAQRYPEWEPTLLGTRDSAEKQARKARELAMADLVVCPSRFVADSLPAGAVAGKHVVVAPFGSPAAGPAERRPGAEGRPLRVLFAGSMTQRKGLADLFAATRLLPRNTAQLFVLGSPVAAPAFYRRVSPDFIYVPQRPHAELLAFMRTCDVFCLPSIVEGRALVVQEAMSAGLPAIVTAHTGTDDVVEDGRSGFVVPVRSPAAIAAKLVWFADNRAALRDFAAAAQRAAGRFSWVGYGETIVNALSGR